MEEGTAELNLWAAQIEGNISLQRVGGDVRAGGLTLKGTLKVKKAYLETLVIEEARVEGNVELSEVGLERGIFAERLVLGGDLRLMEVRLRYSLDFRGAQVGGKFEAKNIEGEGIRASGMQIGKSLIWEEIEAERVDLTGTRVGEELQLRLSLAISGSQMK
jgi:cytoskeletal protein CcmA (bactofilin family)